MSGLEIRHSNDGDIAAIAAIYRHHVLHGLASFEEVAPEPTILATGGFQGDSALVEEHIRPDAPLRLRANPWSAPSS